MKRKVLENVMEVGFHTAGKDNRCPESFPFPACLASALRYVGEDYPWQTIKAHDQEWKLNMANVEFLGASGMAFGLLWSKEHCMSCMDLTQINSHNETIHNAFNWAGYKMDILEKTETSDEELIWKEKIIETIDQNVPVLAFGVIGPPECCIITGYDESGEVIIGWNYFQNEHDDFEATGQFRKRNWYNDTWKLVIIKEKIEPSLTSKQILKNGLDIMRKEESDGYYAGFKAYDAWINFLKNKDIETLDDKQVKEMHSLHSALVGSYAEARSWGGSFLERLTYFEPEINDELLECSKKFKDIHDLMWEIWGVLGGYWDKEAWLKFRESDLREKIISILEQAKKKDKEVVSVLEIVLNINMKNV